MKWRRVAIHLDAADRLQPDASAIFRDAKSSTFGTPPPSDDGLARGAA